VGAQREIVFRTWGGARDGAGRKPAGLRAGQPHVARPTLNARHPVHVTLRVRDGIARLRGRAMARAIRAAMRAVATRDSFRIVQLSIQHDHLHLLVEAGDASALSRGVRAFEISAARRINQVEHRRGGVFRDRYHASILTTPTAVRAALAYVLNNWRKHGEDRGLRDWPVDPYATGVRFDGWRDRAMTRWRAPPGYRPLDPSPPRTWLLARGWRRAGDIGTRDVPGGTGARAASARLEPRETDERCSRSIPRAPTTVAPPSARRDVRRRHRRCRRPPAAHFIVTSSGTDCTGHDAAIARSR
jgi:REP element-mobilizing transposase RayT